MPEESKKAEDDEEEHLGVIQLLPLDIYESEFKKFMERYLLKLPSEMKDSFYDLETLD